MAGDKDLTVRINVVSKAAEAALDRTAAKVANVKASASGGTGAWAAYTGAMKAATGAVRGFFSALGVVGAVMAGVNMVISLWKTLSETIRGPAVRAAEEAADAAKSLRDAEEEAASRAQKHYDAAIAKAREYIAALKEVADYEQGKANAASQERHANVERENAALDKQVAEGTMSSAEASARKRINSLNAAQEDREAQIGLANSRLANARADRNDAFEAREKASEIAKQFAAELEAAIEDENQYVREHVNPSGKHEAGGLHFSTFDEAVGYNNLLSKSSRLSVASDEANARRDAAQGKLEELDNYLEHTEEEVENSLSVLAAQLKAGAAQIETANVELGNALIGTLDTFGKEAAAEANKELDRQASAGSISQAQAAAQQVVNSLQAQLDALVKARDEGAEIAGVQWDSAWIEKALADVQGKLAEAVAKAAVADGIKHDSPKVSSSMVTAGSDPWARIGAFAGNGVQSEAINLQRSSLTALKALQSSTAKIAERMNRARAATTL